jgi:hypothetical protein
LVRVGENAPPLIASLCIVAGGCHRECNAS